MDQQEIESAWSDPYGCSNCKHQDINYRQEPCKSCHAVITPSNFVPIHKEKSDS